MNVKKLLKKYKKYDRFLPLAVVVVAILVIFLMMIFGQKKTPPLDDPTLGDPDVSVDTPGDIPTFFLVEQPLSYHQNYQINISAEAMKNLNRLNQEYSGFKIKNTDHLPWVENLIKGIGKENLEYSKSDPTPEVTIHYWESENDSISYNLNRDFLFINLAQPILFENINLEPKDKGDLISGLRSLAKEYFSENFDYKINDISLEGNYYRVNYSRILNDIPIHMDMQDQYLLLTPDGRLKEGMFLLAELEDYDEMKYSLISSTDLKNNISAMEYPKTVYFTILDEQVNKLYEPYGYFIYSEPFSQKGRMDIIEVELIYYYVDKSQLITVPTFILNGTGLVDVEGDLVEADFEVLASALDSKHVFVHPASYFNILKTLE